MAYIAMGHINQLWNDIGSVKSWASLRNVLQGYQNTDGDLDGHLVNSILKEVNELQIWGQVFPDSPEKLMQILNDRVEQKQIG